MYYETSNYKELNIDDRIKAANKELTYFNNSGRYRRYRESWASARYGIASASPLHIDIELNTACNLKCVFCFHALNKLPFRQGVMDKLLVEKIISQAESLWIPSVKFNWRGEPSLAKELPYYIRLARSANIIDVAINTNGNCSPDFLVECAKSGLIRAIFSLDAVKESTYSKIRNKGSLAVAEKSLLALIKYKLEKKTQFPLLRVQMVRTRINESEASDFIKKWTGIVDDVRVSDVTQRIEGTQEIVIGDQVSTGRRLCPEPFQRLVIAWDGNVYPCCMDWEEQEPIGNISQDNLYGVWNSKAMDRIRKNNIDGIDMCRTCESKAAHNWEKRDG